MVSSRPLCQSPLVSVFLFTRYRLIRDLPRQKFSHIMIFSFFFSIFSLPYESFENHAGKLHKLKNKEETTRLQIPFFGCNLITCSSLFMSLGKLGNWQEAEFDQVYDVLKYPSAVKALFEKRSIAFSYYYRIY